MAQHIKQTGVLGEVDSQPVQSGGTATTPLYTAGDWNIVCKIEKTLVRIPLESRIIIGRKGVGDQHIGFDLMPFGAYEGGVSREHAQIILKNGTVYIEDLNSTNGTRINGFALQPNSLYRLRDGDEIEFGRIRMTIRFEKRRR